MSLKQKIQSLSTLHKWLISILAVTTVVIIGGEVISMIRLQHQIGSLQQRVDYYRGRYEADSTLVENLKDNAFLERFAREQYNMHTDDEDVFVIKK